MTLQRILLIGSSALIMALSVALLSIWFFPRQALDPALRLPMHATEVQIWMESPAALVALSPSRLSAEQRSLWETQLRTWGQKSWGTNLSIRYDLLPVLGQTMIWWEPTTGDWTLRSTIVKNDAAVIMDTIIASYQESIPAMKRTQEVLDDRFPLDMLSWEPNAWTDETMQEQGWSLRTIRPINGSGGLTVARKGQEIILGNLPDAVRTHRTDALSPPPARRGWRAIGSLPRSLLSADLAPILLPSVFLEMAAQGTGSIIRWSVRSEQHSEKLTVY